VSPRPLSGTIHERRPPGANRLVIQKAAKVVRELIRVNGKPPREKDKKDREGCTDANPLSTEPLSFLLPHHQQEYKFTYKGLGKIGDGRTAVMIDYGPAGKPPMS
jgi:hypothetical protein